MAMIFSIVQRKFCLVQWKNVPRKRQKDLPREGECLNGKGQNLVQQKIDVLDQMGKKSLAQAGEQAACDSGGKEFGNRLRWLFDRRFRFNQHKRDSFFVKAERISDCRNLPGLTGLGRKSKFTSGSLQHQEPRLRFQFFGFHRLG